MDLNDIKVIDEGVPVTLVNPITDEDLENDKGKSMRIWMVGKDSKEYNQYRTQLMSKHRNKKVSAKKLEMLALKTLVACTIRFENVQIDGKNIEYSDDAAMALYKRFPWIKDQIDEFWGDRSNFLSVENAA